MSLRKTNTIAAAIAALLAMVFMFAAGVATEPGWLGNDKYWSAHATFAAAFGSAVTSWMMFPHLAKRSGAIGLLRDTVIISISVLVASVLAGTLVFPGAGTAGGPVFVLSSLSSKPALGLIFLGGAVAAIVLSRTTHRE